jgi:HemK-like putative methylase
MAHERPVWTVLATDISESALTVAFRNARRHGVDGRMRFVQADLLDRIDGPFDLIVANPPYVRVGDRRGLQPEVREEPEVALYGGPDGVETIERFVWQVPTVETRRLLILNSDSARTSKSKRSSPTAP